MLEEEEPEIKLYETMLVQNHEQTVMNTGVKFMEQWSILSNAVSYMPYSQYAIGHYTLELKVSENRYGTKMYKRIQIGVKDVKEIDFNPDPERLRQEYLHAFEGIKSEIIYTARYDKDHDIGTTYKGTLNMRDRMT